MQLCRASNFINVALKYGSEAWMSRYSSPLVPSSAPPLATRGAGGKMQGEEARKGIKGVQSEKWEEV